MMSPRGIRRSAFFIYLAAIAMMVALPLLGHHAKGATRWVEIGGFSLQPSEFMKPALIVLASWMFAEGQKGEGVPGVSIAFGLYAVAVALAADRSPTSARPILITIAFGAAFFMAGVPMKWILGLGGAGAGRLDLALFRVRPRRQPGEQVPVAARPPTPTRSTARARRSPPAAWFGRGPGEGILKRQVPDVHTDFAYAGAAEEYGLIFSLLLIALFGFLVVRGLYKAMKLSDPFEQVAAGGPLRAGRPAGLHQHRRQPEPDPDQGHDASLHLLWRLLDAGDGPDHGHGAGADPQAAGRL